MPASLLADLLGVVRRYRWRYARAFLALICANLLLVAGPLIFRHAVTRLDKEATLDPSLVSQWLGHLQGPVFDSVYTWGILLLLVASVGFVFRYLMRVAFVAISRDAERNLREELFVRLQNQGAAFYQRHRVGDLMSRLTNDVMVYREVLGPGVMYPAHFITLVIPILIALLTISVPLALFACVPILILPLVMLLARHLIYGLSVRVQDSLGEMSTLAQEDFAGIRVIKSYAAEPTFAKRFAKVCREFRQLSLRLVFQELFYPFLGFFGRIVTVLLIGIASLLMGGLTSADLVSFMWLHSYILIPVLMMGWILPLYQRGRGAYSRLQSMATEPLTVVDRPIGPHAISTKPDLALEGVAFTYTGDAWALRDVSLNVAGGSLVGITGPPGSGKSTLFQLLNRDYDATSGHILIDGRPVANYPLEGLRRAVAIVEQEPFLFSRTLGENILMAREGASNEELARAIAGASLEQTIVQLPKGLETMVGERGVTLSGGQKQRVAIARALLVGAPILLLDDIFSALDAKTAQEVFETIRSLTCTRLLITHRVSLLERVDQLVTLVDGELEEAGSPADLATRGGHYSALVELDRLLGEDNHVE